MEAGAAVTVISSPVVVQHDAEETPTSAERTRRPSGLADMASRPTRASQVAGDPARNKAPQASPSAPKVVADPSRQPPPAAEDRRPRGPGAAAYLPARVSPRQRRPSGQNQQVTRAQGEERQHVPLPVYLRRRKRELSAERRRASEPPEPEPPPGYRRVGAEEQQQAIETLNRRRDVVIKSQDKLPFRIETIGQRQREKELKERLHYLDRLIVMFSKKIVFVPSDSEPICDLPAPDPSPRPVAAPVESPQVESTMLLSSAPDQQRLPPGVVRSGAPSKIIGEAAAGPFCRLPMQPPGGQARICLRWD